MSGLEKCGLVAGEGGMRSLLLGNGVERRVAVETN